MKKKSSCGVKLDVELSAETVGRLIKVFGERGLSFPEDLDFWLKEVNTPCVARKAREKSAY